jgi:protoheme ferro-lyase
MKYRVTCSKASKNWNRNPGNRYTEGQAKKLKEKVDSRCPGEHTIEPIYE